MALFPLLGRSIDSGTKKIFTCKNFVTVNNLVKDEAYTKNTTESIVIEDTILDHYLNTANEEMAYIIVNNLFRHASADKKDTTVTYVDIAATCKAICNWYAAYPQQVDDSVLPFLDFLRQIEARHNTTVTGKEDILPHFVECLTQILEQLEKYETGYNYMYTFRSPDRKREHISEMDLITLRDLCDIQTHTENINTGIYFYLLIDIVKKCWYLGGDNGNAELKNYTYVWRVLGDLCSFAKWPDYPAYRHNLVTVVKAFTVASGEKGTYNADAPVLNKQIVLSGKTLKTTADAVILRTDEGAKDETYTQAYRVIHGSGADLPKHPYIILCRDADTPNISIIVEDLVEKYAKAEFFNPREAYAVPIMYDGMYYDERIKWLTV